MPDISLVQCYYSN